MCTVADYMIYSQLGSKLVNEVKQSFETLEYDPEELQTLLCENLFTYGVIKRTILLLSDNIYDSEKRIPIAHLIIAKAVKQLNLDDNDTHWEITSNTHLVELTKNIVVGIVEYFSLKLTADNFSWNIEDAIANKELLYSCIVKLKGKIQIEPYNIKDVKQFQKQVFDYLAFFLDKENAAPLNLPVPEQTYPINESPVFQFVD